MEVRLLVLWGTRLKRRVSTGIVDDTGPHKGAPLPCGGPATPDPSVL